TCSPTLGKNCPRTILPRQKKSQPPSASQRRGLGVGQHQCCPVLAELKASGAERERTARTGWLATEPQGQTESGCCTWSGSQLPQRCSRPGYEIRKRPH